ncbi:hypothetical protein E2986_11178, partial [Frieseomelitta varia]
FLRRKKCLKCNGATIRKLIFRTNLCQSSRTITSDQIVYNNSSSFLIRYISLDRDY